MNGYSGQGDVDGRSRLRELRPHRGLRAARFDGRVGEGKDRDRALRALVPRHQGARGGEARRGRRCSSTAIRRTTASSGRRVSRGPDAQQRRRPARQRDQPRRRSVDAGLSEARPASRDSRRTQMEIPHIPVVPISYGNAGELLQVRARPGVPQRLAGRAAVPLSRRARARCARASPCSDDRATQAAQADLRHVRHRSRQRVSRTSS